MKALHRLKNDRLIILIHPPITCCHYTSIIKLLGSAATPYGKHLTLACRQTAKESKPSYTEAVSDYLSFHDAVITNLLTIHRLETSHTAPSPPLTLVYIPLYSRARPVNTRAAFKKIHVKFYRMHFNSLRLISPNDHKLHFVKIVALFTLFKG